MRILLVEDDVAVRRFVYQILASAGYRVTLAGNLADGKREYAAENFDLVTSDGLLPDGNGARWAEEIHERDGQKVLVITGTESSTTVPVLRKPLLGSQLLAKVAEVLGDSTPSAPTTPP